jgi:hypothetical protein
MTLSELENIALWLIMDPWASHPYAEDITRCPDLNLENAAMVERIATRVRNLPHTMVSCPPRFQVARRLSTIQNIGTNQHLLIKYMNAHGLDNIVYLGFHHGRCILNNPTGASSSSLEKYRKWIAREYVGVLCFDDALAMDEKSEKYATLVHGV